MTRPLFIPLFLALAVLAGCGLSPAPTPIDPSPPGPVLPPPPPPPTGDFAEIVAGMSRADVEAKVGAPSFDPPENPEEGVDVVGYDREGGSWMVVYRGGVVERVVWAQTGPVR